MNEVKAPTEQLLGLSLRWAVSIVERIALVEPREYHTSLYHFESGSEYRPDTIAIMKQDWIGVQRPSRGQQPPQWQALGDMKDSAIRALKPLERSRMLAFNTVNAWHPDMETAVLRVYVMTNIGRFVMIPEVLAHTLKEDA